MALPKNSPYANFLRNSISQMIESGIHQFFKKTWIPVTPKCPGSTVRAISMEKIFTLFIIVTSGFGLALIVFVIEFMVKPPGNTGTLTEKSSNHSKLDKIVDDIMEAQTRLNKVEIPGQDLLPERRSVLSDLERLLDIISHLNLDIDL